MSLTLMGRARGRLNHDDVKNLRHCLKQWGADETKRDALLRNVWPPLAEKIRRFLSAVSSVWCLHEESFESDADAVREVVNEIDVLTDAPGEIDTARKVMALLDDLWWPQDDKVRGLLSGERFRAYDFRLMPIAERGDVAGELALALVIAEALYESLEALLTTRFPEPTVGNLLRQDRLWRARYMIDCHLWLPAARLGGPGRQSLAACHTLVYDYLRVLVDILLQLPDGASSSDIQASAKERLGSEGKGLGVLLHLTGTLVEGLRGLTESAKAT